MKPTISGLRAVLALAALLAPACGRRAAPPRPPAFEPGTAARGTAGEPRPAPAVTLPAMALPAVTDSAPLAAPGPPPATPVEAVDDASPPSAAKPPAREDPPLGWIAGQPLEAEELLLEWGDVSSREFFLVLDKLVASRLALAEAGRLGIRLDPERVEQRYTAERERLASRVEARGGKDRTLDEFIERELGFEPARYLERVRRATIRQMLAERAVRAASLASDSVALRLIVVADAAGLETVRSALAAGRDFGEVARECSVDDSKENGGLVPFVVAQERSPLARLAFQTPVGESAGPLPIGDHHFWIRVETRRTPLEGDWRGIESAVEASLVSDPVADAEFVHWKLQMEGRYPIDLGPLWSLIGAAK